MKEPKEPKAKKEKAIGSLRDRLMGATTLDYTAVLETSDTYNIKDITTTPIPALNIAYSADITGGLTSGLTVFAGPSKHFKTLFCLISAAAYLKKHIEAVMLFFDSEFGSPKQYFRAAGIDPLRVIHIPIVSLEELRTELSNQLNEIKRGDKVVIVVDSMGNLASSKEIDDAMSGSEKADMTRAKVGKSLFRIVTPHLRLKDIPMLVVAHTYDTMEMYSKKIVSGGTGIYYSADNLFIIGRQQDVEGTGADKVVLGYDFIINVEKSRYVREKTKIPITVLFDGGVMMWSGLFEIATDAKIIRKISGTKSSFNTVDSDGVVSEPYLRSDVENSSKFWKNIFATTDMAEYIKTSYAVSTGDLITEDTAEIEPLAYIPTGVSEEESYAPGRPTE